MHWLVAAILVLGACGTSPTPLDSMGPLDAPIDSMVPADVDVAICGAIGMACGTCPNGHECIEGSCIRVRGDCGGIVGAACQDTSLTCVYPPGSSGGVCMQPEEFECACSLAPGSVTGCTPSNVTSSTDRTSSSS